MDPDRPMYLWRRMTPDQRKEAVEYRQRFRLPWHGPPHYESEGELYLISAACYEHKPVIGLNPARMAEYEAELLEAVKSLCTQIFAWIVLPNHYHLLVHVPDIKALLAALGMLHGRTSYRWNGEEGCRGRQVWHRPAETAMKSERHFWATLNFTTPFVTATSSAGKTGLILMPSSIWPTSEPRKPSGAGASIPCSITETIGTHPNCKPECWNPRWSPAFRRLDRWSPAFRRLDPRTG